MSSLYRCTCILAILGSQSAGAQWGVQGTIFHHEQMTGRQGMHWTLGFAFDISDRTSLGVDMIGHLNIFNMIDESEVNQYLGYNVGYIAGRKVLGMQYRSTYFLTRENSGLYVGPFIGFRSIRRPITFVYASSSTSSTFSDPAWARSNITSALIFPVGMRIGFRTELDELFGDVYFAIGTQIGSGNEEKVPEYINEQDQLKGFSFQVGYAVGFGWD